MLNWKLRRSEIKNLKKENETTGRLNRSLLNHLTINAEKQTEIKIVGKLKQSNFIKTRYLWNHWITSIPGIGFYNSNRILQLVGFSQGLVMHFSPLTAF